MAIGGYFELELRSEQEFHSSAVRLNTGCNAFEIILRRKNFSKVYLPRYICGSMLRPLDKLNISYQFYPIDWKLEPVFEFAGLMDNEAFVIINYFGLKDDFVNELSKNVPNLIVDNAQSFFSKPNPGVETFYSPRKFFGVPDGAYLYSNNLIFDPMGKDRSFDRFAHLLGRIEYSPEDAYNDYLKNELELDNLPIREMSNITKRLLMNIDYRGVAARRAENYLILENALSSLNLLSLKPGRHQIPMVYPFLPEKSGLREKLIDEGIFVARYWEGVMERTEENSIESKFTNSLIPLPIDQRYQRIDMEKIIDTIIKIC